MKVISNTQIQQINGIFLIPIIVFSISQTQAHMHVEATSNKIIPMITISNES